ncbi:MAG: rubredoxin [Pseudophaeobacter sp. bin_em_oilr2.035]|uniref:Rubredoxin n=1 Tax=Ruegeria aquimaris TaxID=2984333 RepID=A0ABT3AQF2_9RHOB|nr:rubredoxin [Ruegeria sp. XHP0148]MCV2890922.1 rubredoxin [Ruegeria sp. XHP0148]MDF1773958.1 rubredoxin [Pseudophaeobacter sp. bin_em_oilr2.035]
MTCGHIYDEALGDEHEGFAPGTLFSQIPDDWCCPDCGATKEDYVLYEEK